MAIESENNNNYTGIVNDISSYLSSHPIKIENGEFKFSEEDSLFIEYNKNYTDDELEGIKAEAINTGKFLVAELIKELLEYRKKQTDNPITEGIITTATSGLEGALIEKPKEEINSKFESYTKTQIILASMLYDHVKNDPKKSRISTNTIEIDIRDKDGNKVDVTPENIYNNEYQTTIIYRGGTIKGENGNRMFILKNGKLIDVAPASDMMFGDRKIHEIRTVGDYYEVVSRDYKKTESDLRYIIDHNGECVLEGQSGNGKLEVINQKGVNYSPSLIYEYKDYPGDKTIIYNSKLEKLGEYNYSSWYLDYCDGEYCIFKSRHNDEFKVFHNNEVIKEGSTRNFESDLEGIDLLSEYKKNKKSGEESEKEKSNCVVNYNEDEKSLTIRNDNGKVLFSRGNITKNNGYILHQGDTEYGIELKNENGESKILAIKIRGIKGSNEHRTILINKDTGKKYINEDTREQYINETNGKYSYNILGNLIEIISENKKDPIKVFDENFDYIGDAVDYDRSRKGLHCIKTQENGETKFYVVNCVTGEKTEIAIFDSEYGFEEGSVMTLPEGSKENKTDNWGPGHVSYIREDDEGNTIISIVSKEKNEVIRQYLFNENGRRTNISSSKKGEYLVFSPDGRMIVVEPSKAPSKE